MKRVEFQYGLLLFLTLILVAALPTSATSALEGSGELWVLASGDVKATYTIKTRTLPTDVETYIIAGAVYVNVYCDGEPIPFEYNSVSGTLRFTMTCGTARIEAVSSELTSKSGMLWTLKMNPHDFSISVLLPPEAIVVSVKPTDFRATFRDDRIVLTFPARSEVEVEFLLVTRQQAQEGLSLPLVVAVFIAIAVLALIAVTIYKIK
ncbi:MAG: hypothetical protein QW065_04545, partial [Acidilobaceae archaeon]